MTFQFCDLAPESNVGLPELPPPDRPDSDVVFRVSKRQPPAPRMGSRSITRCWPHPGTPPKTIRRLFLDRVMPLVLGRIGRAMLHASAVAIPDGAVAFAGKTGWGKSTLAGAFGNRGVSLLAGGSGALPRVGHYSSKGRLPELHAAIREHANGR